MWNRNIRAASILLATLLMASCHSTKTVTLDGPTVQGTNATFQADKYVAQLQDNQSTEQYLTAKVRVNISMDGQNLATSGNLKMKRNDVIQLSLVDPLVGIAEVGRMEFSPDRVLIIDRYHKQYIDVPYEEVSFLQRANINFNTLQALFWNEIFQPGKSTVNAADFNIAPQDGQDAATADIVNINYTDRYLNYRFKTKRSAATLQQTCISSPRDNASQFTFDYNDFNQYEGKPFPHQMQLTFGMGSKEATLSLTLNSLRKSSDWQIHTATPSKYTKVDPENIFRQLLK